MGNAVYISYAILPISYSGLTSARLFGPRLVPEIPVLVNGTLKDNAISLLMSLMVSIAFKGNLECNLRLIRG